MFLSPATPPAAGREPGLLRRALRAVAAASGRFQKPLALSGSALFNELVELEVAMAGQGGFFDIEERLAGLSRKGDGLERLNSAIDFELFRPELERAVPRADRSKGGRPPFDHVLMFKVLTLQTLSNLSDERTEFFLRDRLTWIRFLGLGLGDPVPDANTIWTFREALTKAGAIERLFTLFDEALCEAGYLAMSGQLVDATIVSAPKQRNTRAEKQELKAGRVPEAWRARPAKLRQKDRDARWTVKYTKAKPLEDGRKQVDLAIPAFGYQNHVGADRRHRLIRRWLVTDAAAHEGSRLGDLLDPGNSSAKVWADSGYRSKKNEALLRERMLVSHIHRKKPPGRPMPERTSRANGRKSAVRAHVEHIFAEQKARMGLFVRTIGLARATVKIGLANLAYNMRRLLWLERQTAPA
jgi:IS5 family transposase